MKSDAHRQAKKRELTSDSALIYILHSGNLYGTERMALATMSGLDEYTARVVFAPLPYGQGSVLEAARAEGFCAVQFANKWELVKAIFSWFKRYRNVAVIGTGVSQGLLCYALAILLRVRLRQLQVAHGGTEDRKSYGTKRHLNHLPIRIIAVSDFVRSKLLHHGVRADSVSVIENFLPQKHQAVQVARPAYDATLVGAQPIDRRRVRVAIVSRVDAIKRIDMVVEAALAGSLNAFAIEVYGTGYEFESLKTRAASASNLVFHGFVSDIPKRLAEADVLLHLCPEEPFGLVILEAFLAKLVAVVPTSGGAGSVVTEGVTGLHFDGEVPGNLVEVLQRVRNMPDSELQRLADAAFASLHSRFSQQEGCKRYRAALATAS